MFLFVCLFVRLFVSLFVFVSGNSLTMNSSRSCDDYAEIGPNASNGTSSTNRGLAGAEGDVVCANTTKPSPNHLC